MRRKRIQIYFILLMAFLLGNYKGYITLWYSDSPTPARIFSYPVTSLPNADQDALKQGIRIHSESELNQILEDFLS